ncbi:hypothetical protein V8D89_001559 [Ganoderma adspersum]
MATTGNGTATVVNPLDLLPKIPPLDNTFGAVLIGTFVGLMLYGITLHQSYRYFHMYPADLPILRFLVSFVLYVSTSPPRTSAFTRFHRVLEISGVKMYANTLMAVLNSRRSLAAKGSGSNMSPFGVSRVPDSLDKDKSMPQFNHPKTHHIEEWQVKSESTAQTDSVVEITPLGSKEYFSESIPLGDIEQQG